MCCHFTIVDVFFCRGMLHSFLCIVMYNSDLGCHIDGFIAVVAHTHVVQQGPVTGRAADVLSAVNTAGEVALRLVRPGRNVSNLCLGCLILARKFPFASIS